MLHCRKLEGHLELIENIMGHVGTDDVTRCRGQTPIPLVRHLLLLAWHLFLVASCYY